MNPIPDAAKKYIMITDLNSFVKDCTQNFETISNERKEKLEILSQFIRDRKNEACINLTFICVHNSRRSHLSQVWAQVAAHYYGFQNVNCYSGGTEVTSLYPAAAKALEKQGLQIQTILNGDNPVYGIKYDQNSPAIIGYSKLFDDIFNPQSDFAAVMVCSSADTNCPYIATAAARILLPFEDPKAFDGTDQQAAKYLERSAQIATELLYMFSKV